MAFDKRLFLFLFIGIFFSTIAGILFHEFGHWAAYRYFGYQARISYSYTGSMANDAKRDQHSIELQYAHKIDSNLDFPRKSEYDALTKQVNKEKVIITMVGPLLTMIAVAIAALALYISRKKQAGKEHLSIGQWGWVFVSMFIIRNLKARTSGGGSVLGIPNDEANIAHLLHWNTIVVGLISWVICLLVISWVIFSMIPKVQRSTFIIAFIAGEITVWILWIQLLGPRLLP